MPRRSVFWDDYFRTTTVQVNGEELPQRQVLNFICDVGTVVDNPTEERIDVTLDGEGGGGATSGPFLTNASSGAIHNVVSTAAGIPAFGIRCTGTPTITGIASGSDPRLLVVTATGGDVVLAHESASSLAANRIITPDGLDLTIPDEGAALLAYDGTSSRWRIIATTSAGLELPLQLPYKFDSGGDNYEIVNNGNGTSSIIRSGGSWIDQGFEVGDLVSTHEVGNASTDAANFITAVPVVSRTALELVLSIGTMVDDAFVDDFNYAVFVEPGHIKIGRPDGTYPNRGAIRVEQSVDSNRDHCVMSTLNGSGKITSIVSVSSFGNAVYFGALQNEVNAAGGSLNHPAAMGFVGTNILRYSRQRAQRDLNDNAYENDAFGVLVTDSTSPTSINLSSFDMADPILGTWIVTAEHATIEAYWILGPGDYVEYWSTGTASDAAIVAVSSAGVIGITPWSTDTITWKARLYER
jgi:hypothetical protein